MPAKTHGRSTDRIYRVWATMLSRCNNSNFEKYKYYGAKGIKVCKRWYNFENFLEDMGEPLPKQSLERKNLKKGYSPNNCHWATSKEQARNRTDNRFFNIKGKKICLIDLAIQVDIPRQTLYARLRRGMTIEEAINTPVRSAGSRSKAKLSGDEKQKLPARPAK